MYVLSKYLLIFLFQNNQLSIGERTLKMVIWPLVLKEQKRGGIRADWFTTDYHLLDNLLSGSISSHNIYANFQWDIEIAKFWKSIDQVNEPTLSDHPPLFAYALAKYFGKPAKSLMSMHELLQVSEKISSIKAIIERVDKTLKAATPPSIPKPTTQFIRKEATKNEDRRPKTEEKRINPGIDFDSMNPALDEQLQLSRRQNALSEIASSSAKSRSTQKSIEGVGLKN